MSDQPLTMDDLQTAWVDFMCDHSNRSLSYEEAVEAFTAILAAHDAEVRADEREKAARRVAQVRFWTEWGEFSDYEVCNWNSAIAAARGDSTKCIPKQSQSVSQGKETHE